MSEQNIIENDFFEILTIGNPLLYEKSIYITNFDSAKKLSFKMVKTFRNLRGAGLAAPQIGELKKLFIIEVKKTEMYPNRPESPLYVMINPEIVSLSKDIEYGWEGCFSIPGYVGNVPRHTSLRIKYFDQEEKEHNEIFEGYLARVIQHEYDHLEGKLFLERMDSVKELYTNENLK